MDITSARGREGVAMSRKQCDIAKTWNEQTTKEVGGKRERESKEGKKGKKKKRKKKKKKKNNNNNNNINTGAEERCLKNRWVTETTKQSKRIKRPTGIGNTRTHECHRETMPICHCRIYTEIM